MISFAQNAEDVMLARLFPGKTDGFYIDIGAADPVEHSVTKHFSDRGWRGVNVEPIKAYCDRLAEARPRDICLPIALGECRETRTFFNISNQYLSTFDPEAAARGVAAGGVLVEEAVEVRTLADICEEHVGQTVIDFLKIDVEGWEEQVIRGGDWSRYRPRVVLVEATEPNSPVPRHERWEPILLATGYQFVYNDGLNRYYLRDEDSALKICFATPPNVFDHYRSWHEVDLEAKARQWYTEKAQAQAELAAEQSRHQAAQAELARLQPLAADRDAAESRAQEAATTMTRVVLERDTLASQNAILTATLTARSEELHAAITDRDGLSRRLIELSQSLRAAQWQTETLTGERDHLQEQLREVQQLLDASRAAAAAERFQFEQRVAEQNQKLEIQRDEIDQISRQRDAYRHQLEKALADGAHWKHVVESLHASRFWRYTALLRGSGRTLKRLKSRLRVPRRPAVISAPVEVSVPEPTVSLASSASTWRAQVKRGLRAAGGKYLARYVQRSAARHAHEQTAPLYELHRQVIEKIHKLEAELARLEQRRRHSEMCLDALARRTIETPETPSRTAA